MAQDVHAIGILYENPRGQILVLLRNKYVPEGDTWGLVGGKVTGDHTPIETAVVKTKAEIGYDVSPKALQFFKTYHWNREDLNIIFDVFRVSLPGNIPVTLDPEGNVAFQWAEPRDIHAQKDVMTGLYPILEDAYHVR